MLPHHITQSNSKVHLLNKYDLFFVLQYPDQNMYCDCDLDVLALAVLSDAPVKNAVIHVKSRSDDISRNEGLTTGASLSVAEALNRKLPHSSVPNVSCHSSTCRPWPHEGKTHDNF